MTAGKLFFTQLEKQGHAELGNVEIRMTQGREHSFDKTFFDTVLDTIWIGSDALDFVQVLCKSFFGLHILQRLIRMLVSFLLISGKKRVKCRN